MICPCCGKHKRPVGLDGMGTALKPAMELIAVARKPLSESTIAENVLQHGTGALNIDGCRIEGGETITTHSRGATTASPAFPGVKTVEEVGRITRQDGVRANPHTGRWPANIVHDGSEEVLGAFPDSLGGAGGGQSGRDSVGAKSVYEGGYASGGRGSRAERATHDTGSAARFFYTAKADADDRLGSKHPTVKPVDLMRWLVRLVTPPGGTVLDPFAGTGTTGEAAFYEGFNAALIEREAEYQADIARRMKLVMAGPDERAREAIKAKLAGRPVDAGPLFGGADTDLRSLRGRTIGPVGLKW